MLRTLYRRASDSRIVMHLTPGELISVVEASVSLQLPVQPFIVRLACASSCLLPGQLMRLVRCHTNGGEFPRPVLSGLRLRCINQRHVLPLAGLAWAARGFTTFGFDVTQLFDELTERLQNATSYSGHDAAALLEMLAGTQATIPSSTAHAVVEYISSLPEAACADGNRRTIALHCTHLASAFPLLRRFAAKNLDAELDPFVESMLLKWKNGEEYSVELKGWIASGAVNDVIVESHAPQSVIDGATVMQLCVLHPALRDDAVDVLCFRQRFLAFAASKLLRAFESAPRDAASAQQHLQLCIALWHRHQPLRPEEWEGVERLLRMRKFSGAGESVAPTAILWHNLFEAVKQQANE